MKRFLVLLVVLLMCSSTYADVQCDGIDDTFSTGLAISNFLTASAGTFTVTLKHTGTIDTGGTCGREDIAGDDGGLLVLKIHSTPRWSAQNWDGTADCANGTYSTNWTHLTWKHSGANVELFVNGVIAATTATGTSTSITNLVQVCGAGDTAGDRVNMLVGEVMFFNTALPNSTINAIGGSKIKGLINATPTARWDFDSCVHGASVDTIGFIDRTGNGRTLTSADGANNTGMTCQGSSYGIRMPGVY